MVICLSMIHNTEQYDLSTPSFSENDSKPNYEQTDINKPHWSDLPVSGRQELCCSLCTFVQSSGRCWFPPQLVWSTEDVALLNSTSLNQSFQSAPQDIAHREVFGAVYFPFFSLCLNLTGRYRVIDRTCLVIKVLV